MVLITYAHGIKHIDETCDIVVSIVNNPRNVLCFNLGTGC
jgi:hypothetical protein